MSIAFPFGVDSRRNGELIRHAELKDLPGLLALYRELRPQDPILPADASSAQLGRVIGHEGVYLIVCESEHTLVSTCMLVVIPNFASGGRPYYVLEHVVTLSAFRRRGFGRATLEFALDLAWAKGCCKVMLLSGAQRVEAHTLYESVGFRGDVERGFVAKPHDAG